MLEQNLPFALRVTEQEGIKHKLGVGNVEPQQVLGFGSEPCPGLMAGTNPGVKYGAVSSDEPQATPSRNHAVAFRQVDELAVKPWQGRSIQILTGFGKSLFRDMADWGGLAKEKGEEVVEFCLYAHA